jgi:peptidoglycan/LPS O-acetylase OafA/YrhL
MKKSDDIHGFNALRALSVGLVILSHIGIIGGATNPLLQKFFAVFNANYGVKTFFVLSGFLISMILVREREASGKINIFGFMLRRATRILPLYFVILAIAAFLIVVGIASPSTDAMLFGTFYIYNFIPQQMEVNYLGHLWSLAVEEQFYLVWPFTFSLLFARKSILTASCIAVVAVCWLLLFRDYGHLSQKFSTGRWTLPAIYPILIGALLALHVNSIAIALHTKVSLALALLFVASPLFLPINSTLEIVNTLGIAGVIAWVYLNQSNAVVLRMDWGPIGYMGRISYGLYMWQGFLTGNGPYRLPGFESFPLEVHIGALLIIPAAMLSFHIFEQPITLWGRRLSRREPVVPVPVTV